MKWRFISHLIVSSNQRAAFNSALQGSAGMRDDPSFFVRTRGGSLIWAFWGCEFYWSKTFILSCFLQTRGVILTTCRKQTNWLLNLPIARRWMKTKKCLDARWPSSIRTLSSKNLAGNRLRISRRCLRSKCVSELYRAVIYLFELGR